MPYIPLAIRQTVTIVRKTKDTRNTFATVASNVVMSIQPAGGGLRYGDVTFMKQSLGKALMQTADTSIAEGDLIRRTGERDLPILRIDNLSTVQQFTLGEPERAGG